MIDDLVDQAIEKGVERVGHYCQDPRRLESMYSTVFHPVTAYLFERMKWFVAAIQLVVSLIVVHTVLLLVILKQVL